MIILKPLKLIALKSMEREELLLMALEVFPELKLRGFFTVIEGVEYYFAGLQDMEIESAYKSFYDEYDFAFSLRCTYSICDCRIDSKWTRLNGAQVYRTPVLYVVNRSEMNESPKQIAGRMVHCYRANTLVLEKYNHPDFSIDRLKTYLNMKGIYFMVKKEKQVQEELTGRKTQADHIKYFDLKPSLQVALRA